jgi:hypothetical protein
MTIYTIIYNIIPVEKCAMHTLIIIDVFSHIVNKVYKGGFLNNEPSKMDIDAS